MGIFTLIMVIRSVLQISNNAWTDAAPTGALAASQKTFPRPTGSNSARSLPSPSYLHRVVVLVAVKKR